MTELQSQVEAGLGETVLELQPVGGGCISPAWRARLHGGSTVFIKCVPRGGPAGLLQAEALSLTRLRAAATLRVPEVVHVANGWMALEWLEPARGSSEDWVVLGRALALLHRTTADAYGWEADNFIGTLPQPNGQSNVWAEFWLERRLRPLVQGTAGSFGGATRAAFDVLLQRAEEVLQRGEADGVSLLHGDLWSGNVHMSTEGPAVIDPASYYGHREVDLAMARLFGGFPREFFSAYEGEWPLLGDARGRVALYQLYYLLVHVRLFGGSYVRQAEGALREALEQAG